MTNRNVLLQKELYSKGMSTREIAKLLGVDRTAVSHNGKKYGFIRKRVGMEIEDRVSDFCKKNSVLYKKMARGDWSYDFLINGKRIDVKSGHVGKDGLYRFSIYSLFHRKTMKDLYSLLDILWLVLLDEPDEPIYELSVAELSRYQQTIAVPRSLNTKYNLKKIGFLESEVN